MRKQASCKRRTILSELVLCSSEVDASGDARTPREAQSGVDRPRFRGHGVHKSGSTPVARAVGDLSPARPCRTRRRDDPSARPWYPGGGRFRGRERRSNLVVMSDKSAIEWTEATWNPTTGCSKVSPGCAHCYAETFAERFRGVPGHPYEQGFDLTLWPARLDLPLRWRRPADLRQLHVRPLPRGDPCDFIRKVFDVDGRGRPAHLPGPDQAPRSPRRASRRRSTGTRTSGWA